MPDQPVRRVVRGTLTQWNRLFRGAGRHSDLVTVRRRSQGDTRGKEKKLSAIGSRISFLFWLAWCSSLCSHSYILSACLSTSSCVSSTFSQFVQLPEWPPCPQGNPPPKVKAKTVLLKWDWFRQAGAEQDPSNKSTSSCQCRIKACGQQLVKEHECSSCCHRWWACYCLACNGHRPVKGIISFSFNNAAFFFLWARTQDTN